MKLRAPFPWFGGKSRAAHLVWPRFGDVPNYIEPFAGSLAVLLARPHAPRVETVNDQDAYLANFWRALAGDPDQVAHFADWPVNEADLHARHRWLVETAHERVERTRTDPEFYDAKVAGWWVWGQCLWIGSGWCARPDWTGRVNAGRHARGIHAISTRNGDTSRQARRPQLTGDQGVVRHANGADVERVVEWDVRPDLSAANGRGGLMTSTQPEKRPYLGGHGGGVGVHKTNAVERRRRPNAGGRGGGQGVQAPTLTRSQIPSLSGDGSASRGLEANRVLSCSNGLYGYLRALSERLRRVRVCCGDWTRVLGPSITTYIGVTGVLLDPPYDLRVCRSKESGSDGAAPTDAVYSHYNMDISGDVRAWALEHGDDLKFRIALCGYESEHEMPSTWECVPWKAGGGYGRTARGKANRTRERIWFSPHCLRPHTGLPFEAQEDSDAISHP